MVHRIEAEQLDLVLKPMPAGREDLREDLRVEEEGRAEIEPEAARVQGSRTAADAVLALEHDHVRAGVSQEHGCREPAGPGAGDDDPRARSRDSGRRVAEARARRPGRLPSLRASPDGIQMPAQPAQR